MECGSREIRKLHDPLSGCNMVRVDEGCVDSVTFLKHLTVTGSAGCGSLVKHVGFQFSFVHVHMTAPSLFCIMELFAYVFFSTPVPTV